MGWLQRKSEVRTFGSLKTRRNARGFPKYIFGIVAWILENKAECSRIFQIIFWNLCVDPWKQGGMPKDFCSVIFCGFDMAGLAELLENRRKPYCDWVMQTQTSVAVGFSRFFQTKCWPCYMKTTKHHLKLEPGEVRGGPWTYFLRASRPGGKSLS